MKKIILAALTVLMMFTFVGCSGALHDGPATIVITFKDGGVLTLTDCGGPGIKVDGSPFSWTGGSSVTLEGYGPVYNITENGSGLPDWAVNQNPWTGTDTGSNPTAGSIGDYPAGFDAPAKLAIDGVEAWVPYKKGGDATYSWNDRK